MILKSRFFRSFQLPLRNEKGFSISENLLAMVILAVNFLALGTISSTLTQSFRQRIGHIKAISAAAAEYRHANFDVGWATRV